MVYKTEILNGIVTVHEKEDKVYFNFDAMNAKQKELFINYKREILRESIQIDSNQVKMDDSLMNALNSNNVELEMKKLNSKQTFLLDCCIKELERKIDPDVYSKHKLHLKRKRNNECASKFRKKRKSFEKINEIIRLHLNDLAIQCKGNLKEDQIEQIKEFLNRNKLSITKKYFENDDSCSHSMSSANISNSSISTTKSEVSSNSSVSSNASDSGDSNDSIEDNVQNMKINEAKIQLDQTNNTNNAITQHQLKLQQDAMIANSIFSNAFRGGYPQYYAIHPAFQQAAQASNGQPILTPVLFLPINNEYLNIRPLIS